MAYNYKRLTLPNNPLADTNFDLTKFIESRAPVHPARSYNKIDNIEELLSSELLEQLKEINLKPSFAIVFASKYNGTDEQALIHYDLTLHNNDWVSVPVAINWELNSTIYSSIKWYDTTGLTGKVLVESPPSHHLNVFHYGFVNEYLNRDDKIPPKIIDEAIVDSENDRSPVLFNTSCAHTVSYSTPEAARAVLSLRFNLDDIPSWDDAVNKFQNFIRED